MFTVGSYATYVSQLKGKNKLLGKIILSLSVSCNCFQNKKKSNRAMLPNKSQTNERDNELKTHSTKLLWGRPLVLAGFYIENNDGIQEIIH